MTKARDWKDRLSRLGRKNKLTLLAFAIPSLILFIAYMSRGIFPAAGRTLLTIDLYHQYAPFIVELQDKLRSGGSLFYSWSGGLGTNFLALFAYYLASPLNFLIVLFPTAALTEAILVLIVLKIGLSGACFYIYLRGVWRQENLKMVALASMYALSAYALAYSWNIMWLDSLYLLPLLLLGMVKLVRDKRYLLYCISLALAIASNYYIAFFICLFTLLYFPVCLFSHLNRPKISTLLATTGKFAGFSLLGGGLASVLLVPTYFSLQLTSAAGDRFPSTVTHYFDLFDYIGQHFMLLQPTIRSGMPNMYSGILALILIPVFFFARSVPLKVKLLHLGMILLLIVSFNINTLNFLWHGMHFPNQLPYRNSFVYIFVIVSMGWPALRSLPEFSGKQIGAICAAFIGVVLLSQKINTTTPSLQTLYVTIIFLAIYAAVLTLDKVRKIHPDDLALALVFVVVAELLLNTLVAVHLIDTNESYSTREGYLAGAEVKNIRNELKAIEKQEGDNFYRVEIYPPKTTNDPYLYSFRGLSIFSSTMAMQPVKSFQNLGYHSNGINSYKNEGSTLVLDSLFGIKYHIRRSREIEENLQNLWVEVDNIKIYENPYALPLGYMGRPELANWTSSSSNPFMAQNRLVSSLSGRNDVFVPLTIEEGDLNNITFSSSGRNAFSYTRTNSDQASSLKLNIINEEENRIFLYLDVTPNQPERGYVIIDEKRIDFNARRSTLVDLGLVPADAKIEYNMSFASSSNASGRFEFYAYALDVPVFEEAIRTIGEQSLQLEYFSDTRIRGTIDVREDGHFLMTIPYDSGWEVKVNGQPTEVQALDNGFISFPLTAGTHLIEMKYMPPWFLVGLLITLVSLLILLVIYQIPGGPGRSIRKKKVRAVAAEISVAATAIDETGSAEVSEPEPETPERKKEDEEEAN